MNQRLRIERHDRISVVTMDDGKVNAQSREMLRDLHAAFDAAAADDLAVLVTGRASVFSAGFDLNTLKLGGAAASEMLELGARLAAKMLAHPAPVVAAVNGHAMAMGAFVAQGADLRIAAADGGLKIAANEVAIGLTLPRFAVALLRHRLSTAQLQRAAITAHTYDVASALAAGWFDHAVPAAELARVSHDAAHALAALPRTAYAATKLRLREGLLRELSDGIAADVADWRARVGS